MENVYITELCNVISLKREKGYKVLKHSQKYSVFVIRLCGERTFYYGNKSLKATVNECVYIPQDIYYESTSNTEDEIIAVHFKTDKPLYNEITKVPLNETDIFLRMYEMYRHNENYELLSELYSLMGRFISAKNTALLPVPLNKALKIINEELENYYLDVEYLANRVRISSVYLRKLFNAYFNVSPAKYIENRRIDKAKNMLKTKFCTISKTAEKCGYVNVKTFSAAFLRVTGKTPKKYRDIHS